MDKTKTNVLDELLQLLQGKEPEVKIQPENVSQCLVDDFGLFHLDAKRIVGNWWNSDKNFPTCEVVNCSDGKDPTFDFAFSMMTAEREKVAERNR